MLDIENDVFEMVRATVSASRSDVLVLPEYTDTPSSLPCVTVEEADNQVVDRMRTERIENAAYIMYEVNVYSNKVGGKKSEAKEIANLVDEAFTSHGFTRIIKQQIPNLANSKIHRIVARYRAVVGPNGQNRFLIYHS